MHRDTGHEGVMRTRADLMNTGAEYNGVVRTGAEHDGVMRTRAAHKGVDAHSASPPHALTECAPIC